MKVYELAKDLKLKSVDLLDQLRTKHNMPFKSHMQSLSDEDVEKIRAVFEQKSKAPSTTKKKTTVIKKRKPSTPKTSTVSSTESEPQKVTPILRTGVIRRKIKKAEETTATVDHTKETVQSASVKEEDKKEAQQPVSKGGNLTNRHIRPGLVSGENQDVLKKISETVESPEEEKKKIKKVLDKEIQSFRF